MTSVKQLANQFRGTYDMFKISAAAHITDRRAACVICFARDTGGSWPPSEGGCLTLHVEAGRYRTQDSKDPMPPLDLQFVPIEF